MKHKIILLLVFLMANIIVMGQTVKADFVKAIANANVADEKIIAKKLERSYSKFTYSYYAFMLNQLPKNALLITNGMDDTFPLVILQVSKQLRTDVKVISLGLLKDSVYLSHVNTVCHINLSMQSASKHVRELTKKSNVFISTTVNADVWFNTAYYLVGLVVQKNSNQQFNQLLEFYDHFKKLQLSSSEVTSSDRQIIKNLLPPLITLYKLGNSAAGLKKDILDLAKLVGERSKVNKIMASGE